MNRFSDRGSIPLASTKKNKRTAMLSVYSFYVALKEGKRTQRTKQPGVVVLER